MTDQRITEQHTHQMVVIHRVFRRGFADVAAAARRLSDDGTPEARKRSRSLAEYATFLLGGLHHHHGAEDHNLWPALLRAAPMDAELTARMAQQHEQVAARIAATRAVLDSWEQDPDGDELARQIDGLAEALAPHLDEEEARILPLIREHLDLELWERMGDEAFAGFSNSEKLIALGQMLDVTTPEEAALFLAGLPLPIRLIWRVSGRRRYERFIAEAVG